MHDAIADVIYEIFDGANNYSYANIKEGLPPSVAAAYTVKNGGKTVGYCVITSSEGYGGEMAVAVGISNDGNIAGVVVLSHSEENGTYLCEGDILNQYVKAIVSGDKTTADALISGATKTGNAISACIEAALRAYETIKLIPATTDTAGDT
ncbi:MAG: FMN-binding protein, partial [Clostridiales bacterium]|nr:FMN-binding protein [Clostridiales bacterium]